MTQVSVSIPVSIIRLRSKDKITIPREKGEVLRNQIAAATMPFFVNLPDNRRTISSTEIVEVYDDIEKSYKDQPDEIQIENERWSKLTPAEKAVSASRGHFLLAYSMFTGKFDKPEELIKKAEAALLDFYQSNPGASYPSRDFYIERGIITKPKTRNVVGTSKRVQHKPTDEIPV